jgi:hypothetical protein
MLRAKNVVKTFICLTSLLESEALAAHKTVSELEGVDDQADDEQPFSIFSGDSKDDAAASIILSYRCCGNDNRETQNRVAEVW